MDSNDSTVNQVLIALRRIARALDLHSRKLVQQFRLTIPQLLVLKEVIKSESLTTGELADAISLSRATTTDILNRLESRSLIQRLGSNTDKRVVIVEATKTAEKLMESAPTLLHERFISQFEILIQWEQTQILSSLQRVADLMDVTDLEVAPLLTGEEIPEPDYLAMQNKKPDFKRNNK